MSPIAETERESVFMNSDSAESNGVSSEDHKIPTHATGVATIDTTTALKSVSCQTDFSFSPDVSVTFLVMHDNKSKKSTFCHQSKTNNISAYNSSISKISDIPSSPSNRPVQPCTLSPIAHSNETCDNDNHQFVSSLVARGDPSSYTACNSMHTRQCKLPTVFVDSFVASSQNDGSNCFDTSKPNIDSCFGTSHHCYDQCERIPNSFCDNIAESFENNQKTDRSSVEARHSFSNSFCDNLAESFEDNQKTDRSPVEAKYSFYQKSNYEQIRNSVQLFHQGKDQSGFFSDNDQDMNPKMRCRLSTISSTPRRKQIRRSFSSFHPKLDARSSSTVEYCTGMMKELDLTQRTQSNSPNTTSKSDGLVSDSFGFRRHNDNPTENTCKLSTTFPVLCLPHHKQSKYKLKRNWERSRFGAFENFMDNRGDALSNESFSRLQNRKQLLNNKKVQNCKMFSEVDFAVPQPHKITTNNHCGCETMDVSYCQQNHFPTAMTAVDRNNISRVSFEARQENCIILHDASEENISVSSQNIPKVEVKQGSVPPKCKCNILDYELVDRNISHEECTSCSLASLSRSVEALKKSCGELSREMQYRKQASISFAFNQIQRTEPSKASVSNEYQHSQSSFYNSTDSFAFQKEWYHPHTTSCDVSQTTKNLYRQSPSLLNRDKSQLKQNENYTLSRLRKESLNMSSISSVNNYQVMGCTKKESPFSIAADVDCLAEGEKDGGENILFSTPSYSKKPNLYVHHLLQPAIQSSVAI